MLLDSIQTTEVPTWKMVSSVRKSISFMFSPVEILCVKSWLFAYGFSFLRISAFSLTILHFFVKFPKLFSLRQRKN